MKNKLLLFIIFIAFIILLIASFILFGISLNTNYFLIFILQFAIFTTPWLVSKVLFNKNFIGVFSISLYLIYIPIFIVGILLNSLISLDLNIYFSFFSLILIIYWGSLLVIGIQSLKQTEVENFTKNFVYLVPIILIYLGILFTIRDLDSIISYDYLQHNAVINNMVDRGRLCILPGQCSNLFLKEGYSTFYHVIFSFLTGWSNFDISKTMFVLDFTWSVVFSIVLFKIFKSSLGNTLFSVLGVLGTLLIFINGAYEYSLFIPQTFAFFIFSVAISIKPKISFWQLLVLIILLFFSHFIIGTYLIILLLIRELIFKRYLSKNPNEKGMVVFMSILIFIFTLILAWLEFRIESTIQINDLLVIGSNTNGDFEQHLEFLFANLSYFTVLILPLVFFVLKQKNNSANSFAIVYLLIASSIYLLRPTYANKFIIGGGIFFILLLLNYIKSLKLENSVKILLILIVLIGLSSNFISNYLEYQTFYEKLDTNHTALNIKNNEIIEYLNLNYSSEQCILISDPVSQIEIVGETAWQTAAAQYMLPESRQAIYNFINNPTDSTYLNLINIQELKSSNSFCFLYSNKLEQSLVREDTRWLNNIYTYIIDSDLSITESSYLNEIQQFLDEKNSEIIYFDDSYALFSSIEI